VVLMGTQDNGVDLWTHAYAGFSLHNDLAQVLGGDGMSVFFTQSPGTPWKVIAFAVAAPLSFWRSDDGGLNWAAMALPAGLQLTGWDFDFRAHPAVGRVALTDTTAIFEWDEM